MISPTQEQLFQIINNHIESLHHDNILAINEILSDEKNSFIISDEKNSIVNIIREIKFEDIEFINIHGKLIYTRILGLNGSIDFNSNFLDIDFVRNRMSFRIKYKYNDRYYVFNFFDKNEYLKSIDFSIEKKLLKFNKLEEERNLLLNEISNLEIKKQKIIGEL